MKKIIKIVGIILSVFLLILFAGLLRRTLTEITYSNLNNANTLNEVVGLLNESGVPDNQVDTFKEQVNFTNDFLAELPNLQGEFITKIGSVAKFDRNLAFDLFRTVVLPDDINCRLTAWNLVKDIISVDPITDQIELSEESALQYYPYTGFVDGDKENFWGVFKGIPAGIINTTKGYSKIIQEEWKMRNLVFSDSNRKLVSCFGYNLDSKLLEVVHAGVMIQKDNQIIFIEKLNPAEPFQVSQFKNQKELEYYLKQRLMSYFVIQPIIMVNDELI